jgi:AraC family transcriptional regulator
MCKQRQAVRCGFGHIATVRKVIAMGVSQLIQGYDKGGPRSPMSYEPHAGFSSLAVAAGFLDAALRTWDEDRIHAKSHVKMAVAMLRDCASDQAADLPQAAPQSEGRCLEPWQARKVREFIDASLQSRIRLSDCAGKARLSGSYLAHKFKATFGMTLCSYIRRRRVERAQQLMLITQQPLSEVALACGFSDQAHYCRVFREVVGLSPDAWRRQHRSLALDE